MQIAIVDVYQNACAKTQKHYIDDSDTIADIINPTDGLRDDPCLTTTSCHPQFKPCDSPYSSFINTDTSDTHHISCTYS